VSPHGRLVNPRQRFVRRCHCREISPGLARNLDPERIDGPPPKRRTRIARAKLSTCKKGDVPVTLGGKLPPVSILSRREFGLRMLRR
jgi:hypothetical protein